MNLLVKITSLQIRRQLRFTYMSLLNVHDLMCNKPGYCKHFEIDSVLTPVVKHCYSVHSF